MWRAFFLAVGISLIIIGAQCLVVEQVVVTELKKSEAAAAPAETAAITGQPPVVAKAKGKGKVVAPPDWAPWSLMAAGTVVVLYSFTIPRRVST